jgi:hypothetical protein
VNRPSDAVPSSDERRETLLIARATAQAVASTDKKPVLSGSRWRRVDFPDYR